MAIVREDSHLSSTSSVCCHCHGHKFTRSEVKTELIALLKISWPVMTNQVLWFLLTVISIIFSGHLGQTELAAAAIGQSVIHVAFRSVAVGYTSTCDTLFAQTYGSTNKKRVGVMFQRGILTTTLVLMVCAGVLINTDLILLLVGQDPEVARLAGVYVYIYLIGAPMDIFSYILTKYLQCQSYMIPTVVVMVITAGLSVVFHYVAINLLGYGLNGVMIAQVSSYYLQAFLLVAVTKCKNLHVETWGGWTLDCLQEWGMVFKLGIPGAFMMCMEWWSFEIGFFVAGTLGNAAVGAHSVFFYIATLLWSAGGGLGIGGSIRIGNALGADQPHKARVSSFIVAILGGK
ncbi:multidrug and toxin extrusion protein 1-like [Amphiura filiformis]|uniref:multidrug and toxin extrusion protein 1-like n=1 Tax=Amphiura filiformis TaxID=82378 RepID=UPI003B217481